MEKRKRYDRQKAVDYARRWAYSRNPRFYDFELIGGDCTNFVSQAIYAGGGVMNHTPTFGWYYYDVNQRAPAWTSAEALYRFLTSNKEAGPVAVETDITQIEKGDVVQLSFDGENFVHSLLVVSVGETPTRLNTLLAAHSYDADFRPLNTYEYADVRFLHITHVNRW